MSTSRAFIFDMDGTLVDNAGFHTQVWLQMLAEIGVRLTAKEFHRRTSGKRNAQILREILGPELSDEEIASYAERKELLYRVAYGPHLKLVAGLDGFLEGARRLDVPMAVATSANRCNIEFVLGGLGIESYFRVVIGAEDVSVGKPHPEAFLTAARRLGVAPERCLVFEDSPVGVEAAHRAGMKAVALTTTVDARVFQGLPAVVQIVDSFEGLNPRSLVKPGREEGS
jgi:beta-phosphoglucomutase